MSIFATSSNRAFVITSPEDASPDPQWTANFLEELHRHGNPVALEQVASAGRFRMFVRTHPGSQMVQYLQTSFGQVQKSQPRDWLYLSEDEAASVCTLYMDDHALLPTAGYSGPQIVRLRDAIRTQMCRDKHLRAVGVRVILQPAEPGWSEDFKKSLTPIDDPGGILSDMLRDSATKRDLADVDQKLVEVKSAGKGFCVEIQVVVIWKVGPVKKPAATTAQNRVIEPVLDLLGRQKMRKAGSVKKPAATTAQNRVIESVLDLLGRQNIWEVTEATYISGKTVSKRNGGRSRTAGPRELMTLYAPQRSKNFAMSAREAAPLWPVSVAKPSSTPPEVLLTPSAAPEPEPLAPEVDAPPITASTDTDTPVDHDDVRAENGGTLTGCPTKPVVSIPTPTGASDEETATVHSARPPELPVTRMAQRKDLSRSKSRADLDIDKRSAVAAGARTAAAQDHGLSNRELLMLNQLGDVPLCSAQDVASIYGWSPTTCYESLRALKGAGLVTVVKLNASGTVEERFWIPDEQWGRIMGDRPPPHTDRMIQWLWLNPQFVAAVYRLVGMAVQDVPERRLLFLRWLRSHPFDAVARFNDGWMLISWSGIWQDRQHLDDRLSKCVEEVNRNWGGSLGAHRPGRIVFVAPHPWQAERVWGTVAGSIWEVSCVVYDLDGDTLTGDLDLRFSRGLVPSDIRDDPSPPRANVARWIDLLRNDTSGHMMRLLLALEQHPGSTPSRLQDFTGINGQRMRSGLDQLLRRELIYQTPNGGYACAPWSLATAARRDRVWVGLPGRRFGPDKLGNHSTQHRKRQTDVQRLLGKFKLGGCSVAPGWQAVDGQFRPDGVVWIKQGPYGPGWHYVVYATSAKQESSMSRLLKHAWSETRTDRYPILVICRPEMEEVCWRLGTGKPMLTASVSRIRSGPVAGTDGTCWLRYGKPVPVLAGPKAIDAEEEIDAGTHSGAH